MSGIRTSNFQQRRAERERQTGVPASGRAPTAPGRRAPAPPPPAAPPELPSPGANGNGRNGGPDDWGPIEWEPAPSRPGGGPRRLPRRVGAGRVGPVLLAVLAFVAAPLALAGLLGLSSSARGGAGSGPPVAQGPTGAVALNGPWTVSHDPGDRGSLRGWATGRFPGRTVWVPNVANPAPITRTAGARNYDGSVAWYRTAFRVAGAGTYAVRFASVNHRATVWMDGRRLGSHAGTYQPFEFRFPAAAGTHNLVVKVDWRDPLQMARDGFHRTWFNFGGINRGVTIRPIAPSEVLSPSLSTRLSPDGHRALVTLSVGVRNHVRARPILLAGTLAHGDKRIKLPFATRSFAARGTAVLRSTVSISDPALWSPSHPNLYDLQLGVAGESGYRARVGLRQLTWSGGRIFLNGRPLALHGASIEEDVRGRGDALTGADQDAIVNGLKSLGANATRSQHPLDDQLLARLDAAGILVWQGIGPVDAPGNWSSQGPRLTRLAEDRARATVREERLHPSVIAWNLANEIANNGHSGGQVGYVNTLARQLHASDPGRLVALDVWGQRPPRVAGPIYRGVDAIGATDYVGWYEDTFAPAGTVQRDIRARVEHLRRVFAGRVLIVSEFGAEANYLNRRGAPGGIGFQARLLRLHIRTYRQLSDLSGMLVWNLRDFAVTPSFAGGSIHRQVPGIRLLKGLNQKGLYDYDGRPKPAVGAVRRAFAGLPAG